MTILLLMNLGFGASGVTSQAKPWLFDDMNVYLSPKPGSPVTK